MARSSSDLEETLFLTTQYALIPGVTWLNLGLEFSKFENLKKRPVQPPPAYVDDFRSLVYSILFTNTSDYLGYKLTLNVGLQVQRQTFEEATNEESTAFMRIFAGTGEG